MNILHTECGLHWGGQEFCAVDQTRWLNAHGHRAWIACDRRSKLAEYGSKLGVPLLVTSMRNSADVVGLRAIYTLCRREKIEIIHTHGSKDSWICFPLHCLGYPVVRTRHVSIKIKPGLRSNFTYRYGCRHVMVSAQILKHNLVGQNGLPSSRVTVTGDWVDMEQFNLSVDGSVFRKEFGISPDAPLIGNIGMIRRDKGQSFFIDAAFEVLKKHPEARFVIVGSGIGVSFLENELRARIENAGEQKRIIMTGYRWDIPQITAALDILVVASIDVECQSRTIPQAFATRRAVVATQMGGIPDLVKNEENGLLVPPRDSMSMAAAIQRLIEDADLRRKMAAAGHELARQELTLDRKMEETLKIYEKAMRRQSVFAPRAADGISKLKMSQKK